MLSSCDDVIEQSVNDTPKCYTKQIKHWRSERIVSDMLSSCDDVIGQSVNDTPKCYTKQIKPTDSIVQVAG